MRPSETLKIHRDAILNATKRFKVTNPRVFGSTLHGTDTEESDLDLLVDALPGATLFDLGGFQEELQTILGVKVDVLTSGGLRNRFGKMILAEAKPI